jgi:hypothetical protein
MAESDFTPDELKNEIWKPCVQDERYAVSNFGRVKRVVATLRHPLRESCLKQQINTNGYAEVSFFQDEKIRRYRVHQLICRAFHGDPPTPKHEPNHKDHVRTNNRAENLEWTTRKENLQWAKMHGRNNRGSRNGRSKLAESDVLQIIHLLKTTQLKHTVIADQFGVTDGAVQQINVGKRWQYLLKNEALPLQSRP